ncbi:hypothetical protein [Streptomyces sp. NPDC005283]|uniref:hypothetical protein n=1 Tax=Streptomyces sp. NPDC005283 TaxID=3156871 RepID=UPI0034571561
MSGEMSLHPRWSHLADRLPPSLEDLHGPPTGVVRLPQHLAWSGLTEFDLGDEQLVIGLYRIVLNNGQREDLVTYLNAGLLRDHWPVMRRVIGKPLRSCWEQHFPQLAPAAAA